MTNKDKFEIEKHIVNAGGSEVFNAWHKYYGITKDEFLTNLKWLMEDTDFTRELMLVVNADAQEKVDRMFRTPKEHRVYDMPYDEKNCEAHIEHIFRVTDDWGNFVSFCNKDGLTVWPGSLFRLSPRDRI